ncbi:MAG TPA: 23S rRNA (guanosine(2251)-2'-O)-methyltransferase RlmB [Terriglobales bacterium]|nr:23S rRNA (guanosine(2251)-2'-O)-methyltransferase RlmB [Terriglobales bacterium]
MKGKIAVNANAGAAEYLSGVHAIAGWLERQPQRLVTLYHEGESGGAAAKLIAAARAAGVSHEIAPRHRLDQLAAGARHQGVVARVRPFPYADLDQLREQQPRLLLALDQINDPRNLGAIIRSSAALGAGGILLPRDGSVGVTAVAETAASGNAALLPICRVGNLARTLLELKEEAGGYWMVGLDAAAELAVAELSLPDRVVLVVGGEAGVRRLVRERCDFTARIPMAPGVESLNAAVAAAIGLYEIGRQWNTLTR